MRIRARYATAVVLLLCLLITCKVYILDSYTMSDYGKIFVGGNPSELTKSQSADDKNLIVSYGKNDLRLAGELGRGVIFVSEEKAKADAAMEKYRVNVYASDLIPLNRMVPDSRPPECSSVVYPDDLPTTGVVIPFHNEWPSILLRTVYSLINRTPKYILKQIILVDDASDLDSLKENLDVYIKDHFPGNLVKLIRLKERVGLIKARLVGFEHVTTEVVSFFDSHMEVNVQWLEPLLVEIKKNWSTLAMGHLDYIKADTLQYDFEPGYKTRYGFDWRLVFFETYFRSDQRNGRTPVDPLPGVVMVGPAFAINTTYFKHIGKYDGGMKIWGGENIELAWRVWMCGGRLLHLPCSKIGHIARVQPYIFPEGRHQTEIHNYKRAVDVWMGNYSKYVYDYYPDMKDISVGDLSERFKIKERLKCRSFDWYLENVWPELFPYEENVVAYGGLENLASPHCLDNGEYLFQAPVPLEVKGCIYSPPTQGFSLTKDLRLRTTLQCVNVIQEQSDIIPFLQDCIEGPNEKWQHKKGGFMRHKNTGLCLDMLTGPKLIMQKCDPSKETQKWKFRTYKKKNSVHKQP
ncbi:inactive polypeptide N-acetylgalactosaminyltransferase-like protein 5 [Patella vulgata]|uniref:inactive polypeptide N-acetylgalactosaminyltransferase-like protein 5 n=1 Tax=Patella vulgata TaxID=6465 RepID=UPI002180515F|nr:inactive polypeptide N-acetylgalactosaminyltransferase-like protein 5 [Patella vulgata]XP_050401933.1 inactive polypeptide N-acetylgalactosaminyltransferase-like protein 5 [Patella vulgata]XP_050401934.1 inactive polypeptide N-acetylgalactosaminyltransferase-like protein 5 [Patella vulgata]